MYLQHAILAHLRHPPEGFEEPTVSNKPFVLPSEFALT